MKVGHGASRVRVLSHGMTTERHAVTFFMRRYGLEASGLLWEAWPGRWERELHRLQSGPVRSQLATEFFSCLCLLHVREKIAVRKKSPSEWSSISTDGLVLFGTGCGNPAGSFSFGQLETLFLAGAGQSCRVVWDVSIAATMVV